MIFTTLFDDAYFCGLLTLMQSMRENSRLPVEETAFLLVYEDEPTEEQKIFLRELYPHTSFIPRSDLGDILAHTKQVEERMYVALKKMLLFGLPVDEKVCFIDADILCLNSMVEIDRFEGFSAVIEKYPGNMSYDVLGRSMFNTGFFIFNPSFKLMTDIIGYYQASEFKFNEKGDQTVINYYFYDKCVDIFHAISSEWNVVKRLCLWDSSFDLTKIKLLHYVGINPWEVHRYGEQFEWRYRVLNRLWWQYFKKAPGYEYCCQRYQLNEPDWNKLEKLSRYYELRHSIKHFCKSGRNKLQRLLGKTAG